MIQSRQNIENNNVGFYQLEIMRLHDVAAQFFYRHENCWGWREIGTFVARVNYRKILCQREVAK